MEKTIPLTFDELAIRVPIPGLFASETLSCDLDSNPIVRHYELNHNIPTSPKALPMGSLTILPNEILLAVLCHLDLTSVLSFRSVNQRCATIVQSSIEFDVVAKFPKALSTVVTLDAKFCTMGHLAASLTNLMCSRCEAHFGELLYVITGDRVCYTCWRRYSEYIPVLPKKASQLPPEIRSQVPVITLLPGYYGVRPLDHWEDRFPPDRGKREARTPGPLLDSCAFWATLNKFRRTQGIDSDLVCDSLPGPEPHRAARRSSLRPTGAALYKENAMFEQPFIFRYMSFIRAPYYDEVERTFIGGYTCLACIGRGSFHSQALRDPQWTFPTHVWHEPWRRYTRQGFLEHMEKHGPVFRSAIDSSLAHDSERMQIQTLDDVQWEMYREEWSLLATPMNLRDDHPIPMFSHHGCPQPHNSH